MSKTKKDSFETELSKLNDIVDKLESEQMSIEASLRLYEQGMSLVTTCQQYLDNSQERIVKVQRKNDDLKTSDFSVDDDND